MNIGVIGCGRIAGHHCRSIAQTPGLKIVATCDLALEKAAAYGKEHGVPAYANYHEMFRKHPELDAVVIATPSGMHFEHATEILRRYGKSVIVEKPTFLKIEQVKAAYALAAEKGARIYPIFQNRYNKAVQRVLQGLRTGELGALRILSVRVRWCRPQRYYDLAPWRGTFAQDGGALTNQGVHHLDLARFLGGEVARVTSSMRTLGAKIEVEDAAVGLFEFRSGAVGNLEVTTAARPDDFEASISLVCEKGLAQIGGIAVNELQLYTPDPASCAGASEDFAHNVYGNGHAKLYRDIQANFSRNDPYPIPQDDCLGTVRLLNSFYRADEEGGWVESTADTSSQRLGRPDEKLAELYRTGG